GAAADRRARCGHDRCRNRADRPATPGNQPPASGGGGRARYGLRQGTGVPGDGAARGAHACRGQSPSCAGRRAGNRSLSGALRMLEVENVDLFYGASQALRAVSCIANIGAVTCVMGRNGVGKTSLLRAIAGQQPIRRGSIRWGGTEISGLAPHQRARLGIASVPQGRDIFSQLSVLENLKTGFAVLPRRERRVPEEIFELFPVLRQMLGRRGGDLSGGQL